MSQYTQSRQINIFFVLPFIIGCFTILNPSALPTASTFIFWSFMFGLIQAEIDHHPKGKLAQWIHKW